MTAHTPNSAQLEAIRHTHGPLLVLAGAGTGKTQVITAKIIHLIETLNISPKNIVAVTFTNKAAREMSLRVQKAAGSKARALRLSTFHNFGLQFIKKELKLFGLRPGFSIFDTQDSLALLRELQAQESVCTEDILYSIANMISHWKNDLIQPPEALKLAHSDITFSAAKLYALYAQQLQSYNALDFDDLIVKPTLALQEHDSIREHWQHQIHYMLVDEYQDTNACQYALLKLLVGTKAHFTVVGDDDQSVYAWRGARPENIVQLHHDFKQLTSIKLEQNYRSTNTILSIANHLIQHNPHLLEKKLWSQHGMGDRARVLSAKNDLEEAERIVTELLAHKFQTKGSYADYAILYRSNHQSRLFEQVLRSYSVPYQLSGGQSFFARAEIKDHYAYLRLLVNQDDDSAFLRAINTPKREIGPQTLEKLGSYAQKRCLSLFASIFEFGLEQVLNPESVARLRSFADWITFTADNLMRGDTVAVLRNFFEEIAYRDWLLESNASQASIEKRISFIEEFKMWLFDSLAPEEGEPLTLAEVLQKMMLLDLLDRKQDQAQRDAVQLSTIHAAKGLEFPHVFLIGLEEGVLPHQNSIDTQNSDAIEEERRLCYVGITRAMKTLTLSHAQHRRKYGEEHPTTKSRFLEELPKDYLDIRDPEALTGHEQKNKGIQHLTQLRTLLQEKA